MRAFCCLLLLSFSTDSFAQDEPQKAPITHDAYEIPFGATDNTLELTVTNTTDEVAIVTATLSEIPEWIQVEDAEIELDSIAAGEDAVAVFKFDVTKGAPVDEVAALEFVIEGEEGSVLAEETVWVESSAPRAFRLIGAYPNPLGGTRRATVAYDLPSESDVTLVVYDVLGRRVATVVDEVQEPGRQKAVWNAGRVASGLYVWRLVAETSFGRYTEQGKLTVVR